MTEKQKWERTIKRVNRWIRQQERIDTFPPPLRREPPGVWLDWNIQDDASDVGWQVTPAPFPFLVMRWPDGRTWWDEVRVLQFVFGPQS
jgi:hypothetical protein